MLPIVRWFDQKYIDGKKPTLEDKAELFRQLGIRLNGRAKDEIKDWIKQALFELKREYKPSLEVLAHSLVFCLGPLAIERDELKNYISQYEEVMRRHKEESVFAQNYG